jgi:hypothetical protein
MDHSGLRAVMKRIFLLNVRAVRHCGFQKTAEDAQIVSDVSIYGINLIAYLMNS